MQHYLRLKHYIYRYSGTQLIDRKSRVLNNSN